MSRTAWADATGGVAGDMLLGALLDAGADLDAVQDALDALDLGVKITTDTVLRAGFAATLADVCAPETTTRRGLSDVLELLGRLDPAVGDRAAAVFRALAGAEARVHRSSVDEVHFHEVGALDAIADVVGVVAALTDLDVSRLVSSPIALGGGRADTAHGVIPVPGPAVLELLSSRAVPAFGGPVDVELATPTGVALLATLADEFVPMPPLQVHRTGVGAGRRELPTHANVTRVVLGSPATANDSAGDVSEHAVVDHAVILETNVDDLDPRAWPAVLAALLDAGASDAWLTPILMKKGRPAHTLSVLAEPALVPALERVVFAHTSTIGLRRRAVDKIALAREIVTVDVLGTKVRVKAARLENSVVNATPEYDDVAALAARVGLPVADALRLAQRAADDLR